MTDALRALITDEDPDSRVTTRKAVQRAQLEVAGEVGYGTQAIAHALEARPDLILLAVEEPAARPLETADALANALPETPFIIYSSLNDPEAVRRSMVFGARDYILKPVQSGRLLEAVNTVLLQQERRQMRSAGQLVGAGGRGSVIAITGAKGGIGKSVISVNLSLALRMQTGGSVAIMDVDTDFGDVATMLDLTPTQSLVDLFRRPEPPTRESIQEYMTRHPSGLEVLAAPPDGEGWERCDERMIKRVVDVLAQRYDFVVVDTCGSFNKLVRACVEASTLTLVVTSGEVSSIRDTTIAMRRVSTWNVEAARLKLLLNRGARVNGFSTDDLKQAIGHEVFWEIPADNRLPLSVQVGEPVMLKGESIAAKNIAELARRIAGTRRSLVHPGQQGEAGSPLKRLLQRGGAKP